MRRRLTILSVLIVCIPVYLVFTSGKRSGQTTYNGKSLSYWEAEALIQVPQGNFESAIMPAVEKMGPEAIPFWLKRLEARDSAVTRAYSQFWSILPNRIQASLPTPIPARVRRSVANLILSKLYFTNGMPELIQMSYSKDTQVQGSAIHLLWLHGYLGHDLSRECIAAFGSALQTGDFNTRVFAIQALNMPPMSLEALPALHLALNDAAEEIRVKAASALIKLQPENDLTHIFEAGLTSSNQNVRVVSEVALSDLKRRQQRNAQESGRSPPNEPLPQPR